MMEPLVELGREVDSAAGDVDHVTAALTVTESVRDVVVEREVWEPVQRRKPGPVLREQRLLNRLFDSSTVYEGVS